MKTITAIVRQGLDARLPQLLEARQSALRPARGWLRAAREAIGANQQAVAKRMGVKRQSYARLEDTENQGSISLASLQKAAEAMDCDVVYYLVPKPAVAATYEELARKHDPQSRHLAATEHSMALENQTVEKPKPKP